MEKQTAYEETGFIYYWRIKTRLAWRKSQLCKIVLRGKKNSVLVEFLDGHRVVTSGWSVRKQQGIYEYNLKAPVLIETGVQVPRGSILIDWKGRRWIVLFGGIGYVDGEGLRRWTRWFLMNIDLGAGTKCQPPFWAQRMCKVGSISENSIDYEHIDRGSHYCRELLGVVQ